MAASVHRMLPHRPNLGNAKPPNPLSPIITTADRPIPITHHHLTLPHRHFTILTRPDRALGSRAMTLTQCSPENVLRVILHNSNRGLEWIRRLCTNSSIVSGPLPNRPPIGRLGAVGFSVMPCGSDITWDLTCTSFSPLISLYPRAPCLPIPE